MFLFLNDFSLAPLSRSLEQATMFGEERKPLLIPLRHCSGEGSTTTNRLLCGGLCICAAERVLLSSESNNIFISIQVYENKPYISSRLYIT